MNIFSKKRQKQTVKFQKIAGKYADTTNERQGPVSIILDFGTPSLYFDISKRAKEKKRSTTGQFSKG